MRATIKRIIDTKKLLVEIETDAGLLHGYWQDSEPIVGKQYDIEIDIDSVVDNDKTTIEPIKVDKYLVFSENGHTVFQCQLEDFELDGVLTLRILNSIFLVLYTGDSLIINEFYLLKVNTEKVLLYDTHTI